jgi:hypothetical protein
VAVGVIVLVGDAVKVARSLPESEDTQFLLTIVGFVVSWQTFESPKVSTECRWPVAPKAATKPASPPVVSKSPSTSRRRPGSGWR